MSNYLDVIFDSIQTNRCTIMTGPDMAVNHKGVPVYQDLQRYFEKETDLRIEYDLDNFIRFNGKSSKRFYYSDLKKYYKSYCQPTACHEKLTRIPCSLFLSITPDLMLKQAFERNGVPFDFHFYNKKVNPKEVKAPKPDKPLIYNLFGSIQEEDSLIITHEDLFNYLFSILGAERRLPRELKNIFRETRVFVFLGFDLEKWYVKLLLRLFGVQDSLPIASGFNDQLDNRMKAFYINNFEMQFLDEDSPELIDRLFEKFEKEGKLKSISEIKENPLKASINEMIRRDELEGAIERLSDHLEEQDEDLFQRIMVVSATFYRLKKKINIGVVDREQESLELNKIRSAILEIVNDL